MKTLFTAVLSLFLSISFSQTFDNTFKPVITGTSEVRKIVRQPDDKLVAIGDFVAAGAVPVANIVRINTDGSVDHTFNGGTGFRGPAHVDMLADVVRQSDGKFVVAGFFSHYNGVPVATVARLNADGTLDDTFNPGTGANSPIASIAVQTDGKILLRGYFTAFNGSSHVGIVRLNANGSVDETFNTTIEYDGPGSGSAVYCIALQADGKILVGGKITSVNDESRDNIVRLNTDGTIDATFTTEVDEQVNSIFVQTDGKILLGGRFTEVNGLAYNQVVRLNSDGTVDTGFTISASFFPSGNSVQAVAAQADGKVLVGGSFQTPAYRILRLNANGTRDTGFNVGSGVSRMETGFSEVTSIAILSSGKIIISGDFNQYGSTVRLGVVGLAAANAAIDVSFDPQLGAPGSVRAVHEQADGKVIIGGSFLYVNGYLSRNFARLNSNGTFDASYVSGNGFNGPINDIKFISEGPNANKLMVAGSFSQYNSSTAHDLVRLNPDGLRDNSFVAASNNGSISSIVVLPGTSNDVVFGGDFTLYNGVEKRFFAKVNNVGTLDNAFNNSDDLDNGVSTVALRSDGKFVLHARAAVLRGADGNPAEGYVIPGEGMVAASGVQPDDKILAGGYFTTFDGVTTKNIARLNDNGSVDPTYKISSLANEWSITRIMPFGSEYTLVGLFYSYATDIGNRIRILDLQGKSVPTSLDVTGGVNNFYKGNSHLYISGLLSSVNGTKVTSLARADISTAPASAPSSLSSVAEKGKITLTWTDDNTMESGFEVMRSLNDNSNYVSVGYANANAVTFVDNTVEGSQVYFYKVCAINLAGKSAFSNEVSGTAPPSAPFTPSGLTATELTPTSVRLTWNDNSVNETGFKVYFDNTSRAIPANATTFDVVHLDPGRLYLFFMRAVNEEGESSYSPGAVVTLSDPASGGWSAKTAAPALVRTGGVTFTIGTKAYMTTGQNSTGRLDDLWEYDAAADAWTAKTNFTGSARTGAVGFAVGGYGYVGLGNDGSGSFKRDFYRYDPVANGWTAVADFPEDPVSGAGRSSASAFVIGDYAYVALGNNGTNFPKEFWRYDPSNNVWEQMANFPGEGRSGGIAFAIGDRGYVGLGFSGSKLGDLWNYNPAENKWYSDASIISSYRSGATAFVIDGRAYIGTGDVATSIFNQSPVTSFYEFNPANTSQSWRFIPPVPNARTSAISFAIGNKGYVGFGIDGSTYLTDVQEYAPRLDLIPRTPTGFTATLIDETTIKLSWADQATNEDEYIIESLVNGGGSTFSELTSLPANSNEYVHENLQTGKYYSYRIRAANSNGYSSFSSQAGALALHPPVAATNLAGEALSPSEIKLTWTDNSSNESGFRIEYSFDGNTFTYVYSTAADATEYVFRNGSAGLTYYFRVKSENMAGSSAYTDVVSITTKPGAPSAPSLYTPQSFGATYVKLEWYDYATNETEYKIYQSSPLGVLTVVASTAENVKEYTVKDLTPDTHYDFKVTAVNETGESSSSTVTLRTHKLDAPTDLVAKVVRNSGVTSVSLTWNGSGRAGQQFQIHRSVDGGDFQQIGTSAVDKKSYSDNTVTSGKTYMYKVRVSDALESTLFSNEATITPEELVTSIEEQQVTGVRPNPVRGTLFIEKQGSDGEVIVSSLAGNELLRTRSSAHFETQLDLSNLPVGVYIVTVRTKKNIQTTKVFKH